jgi:hypothetical protein
MRRNKTPFFPLNYTGMTPDQDGPDRGLLHNFVGYPVFKGPEKQLSIDRQTRPSRPHNGQYTKTGPLVNRLRTNFLQKVVHWWTEAVE